MFALVRHDRIGALLKGATTMFSPVRPFSIALTLFGLLPFPSSSPKKPWCAIALRWLSCGITLSGISLKLITEIFHVVRYLQSNNVQKVRALGVLYDIRWPLERVAQLAIALIALRNSQHIIIAENSFTSSFRRLSLASQNAKGKRTIYFVASLFFLYILVTPFPALFAVLKEIRQEKETPRNYSSSFLGEAQKRFPVSYTLVMWYSTIMGKVITAAAAGMGCVTILCANFGFRGLVEDGKSRLESIGTVQKDNIMDVAGRFQRVKIIRLDCEKLSEYFKLVNRAFSSILAVILLTDLAMYLADLSWISAPARVQEIMLTVNLFYEISGFAVEALIVLASIYSTNKVR